jgi:predicted DNA-binding transcriptional regulator AlpA
MRLYRFRDLKGAGVPFTRKHVAHLERREKFPRHLKIGENSISWIADEVDRWVEDRIRGRDFARGPGPGHEPPNT